MLRGKLVVLRPIEPEHLPNYVRWFADPDVLMYFGTYRPMNLAGEQAWYEAQNKDPIHLQVFADNLRAVLAYEQVGFVFEGRYREVEWRLGRWHDLLIMSILRHEWSLPDLRHLEK